MLLQQTPIRQSAEELQAPLLHLLGATSGVGVGVVAPLVVPGVEVVTSLGVGVETSLVVVPLVAGVGVVVPLVAGVGVTDDPVHFPGGRSQLAFLAQFIGGGVYVWATQSIPEGGRTPETAQYMQHMAVIVSLRQ